MKEDIMRSIYAKSRDNARTPMQWSAREECRIYNRNAVDQDESELYGDQCEEREEMIRIRYITSTGS